ncbi:hypothetical protein FUAX_18460 [Fulvitalea axinellae]|uniref:Uncharacterized protein n=1 Tax=Fulvitalea axinellae TaxID=1182444 RepID=A0AAU9CSJ2_9BACT|nr:hypothetical protein FUAX_18460 [Fulvitalea axinellae]
MKNRGGYIARGPQAKKALDFKFLREKGISIIQELAGNNWTDYNVHDPGVTILDQLCYALTDMGYRSGLDIRTLLASQEGSDGRVTFLPPEEILTTAPLTLQDSRKMLIDGIDEICNAWFIPLSQLRDSNVKGLYLLLVELKDNAQKERCHQEISELLSEYRNLGEDIYKILFLEPQEINVQCTIVLENDYWAEEVHAQVLFLLDKYISKPVRFRSLEEMRELGFKDEEIYEGPRLERGFILDESLKPKDFYFRESEFINLLLDIPGIKSVKHFDLLMQKQVAGGDYEFVNFTDRLSGKEVPEAMVVGWTQAPRLAKVHREDVNNPLFFKYLKRNTPLSLFQDAVISELKRLEAEVRHSYKKKMAQGEVEVEDLSDYRIDLSRYTSIQNHFPSIYRLTEKRLDNIPEPERRSEVLQLKGFLLLFEQILSNHLAQLSHFGELYSLDPELETSFYAQVPEDILQLDKLIPYGNADVLLQTVEDILHRIDDFGERRLAFLKHLMNRFGERYDEFPFHKFNFYPEFRPQSEIFSIIRLLGEQGPLSTNKAVAPPPLDGYWRKENYSVLERRMRLKLDLPLRANKFASELFPKVFFKKRNPEEQAKEFFTGDFKFHERNSGFKGIWDYSEKVKKGLHRKLVEQIEVDEELFRRGIWEDNYRLLRFVTKKYDYTALLFNSYEDKSFWVERIKRDKVNISGAADKKTYLVYTKNGKVCYVLEFLDHDVRVEDRLVVWRALEIYRNEEDAAKAAFSLKELLIEWNYKSEGLYVIDHILLRPRKMDPSVKLLFRDGDMDLLPVTHEHLLSLEDELIKLLLDIRSIETSPFVVEWDSETFFQIQTYEEGLIEGERVGDYSNQKQAEIALAEMESSLSDGKSLKVVPTQRNVYSVLSRKAEKVLAKVDKRFLNETDAQEFADRVTKYVNSMTEFGINRRKDMHVMADDVKGEFASEEYNFTVTVLLPGWTARFHDREFRHLTEGAIRKNTPAHIALRIKWISLNEMVVFEKLYSDWIGVFSAFNPGDDCEKINALSDELMRFLKGMYTLDSPMDVSEYFRIRQEY